jgi:hypothetical protein
MGVPFHESPFFACLACGLVWSSLQPDELRAHVETHGDAKAKCRLPTSKAYGGD